MAHVGKEPGLCFVCGFSALRSRDQGADIRPDAAVAPINPARGIKRRAVDAQPYRRTIRADR